MKKYYLQFNLTQDLGDVIVKAKAKQDYDMSVSSKEECLEALKEYSGGDLFETELFKGLDFLPSLILLNLSSGDVESPEGVKIGEWELVEEPFEDSWIKQKVEFTFLLQSQEMKESVMEFIKGGVSDFFGEESEVDFTEEVLTISTPSNKHKTVARFEVV